MRFSAWEVQKQIFLVKKSSCFRGSGLKKKERTHIRRVVFFLCSACLAPVPAPPSGQGAGQKKTGTLCGGWRVGQRLKKDQGQTFFFKMAFSNSLAEKHPKNVVNIIEENPVLDFCRLFGGEFSARNFCKQLLVCVLNYHRRETPKKNAVKQKQIEGKLTLTLT
jgi:hypothetical protein